MMDAALVFALIAFGFFCFALGWFLSAMRIYREIDSIIEEARDLDTK